MRYPILKKFLFVAAILSVAGMTAPTTARAGVFEVSFGFSFSQSNYSDSNYNWNRKWGASVGYHLSELSEIEFSFEDITDRTKIATFEDTTFHDKVYGVNWVQSLVGKSFPIQPYFKIGVGQLNREANGNYQFGFSPPAIVDSITGILGAGLRISIMHGFGLRAEANTYLTGGSIRTWQDNISCTFGGSLYF